MTQVSLMTKPPSAERAPAPPSVTVTQYSRRCVVMIWAAAAVPMAILSWIAAPAIVDGSGIEAMVRPLMAVMTVGLVWQFVLAVGLVGYEQRSLRWSRMRAAMWLRAPQSPGDRQRRRSAWLVLIPAVLGFALVHALGGLPVPSDRDFGQLISSDAGQDVFEGAWGLYALFLTMSIFNTVLGEELLFRGVLLPRMERAFGKRDWVANGVLFGLYHLHAPWSIPGALLDTLTIAYPSRRYRSAWIGIAVHSSQTLVLGLIVLMVVI